MNANEQTIDSTQVRTAQTEAEDLASTLVALHGEPLALRLQPGAAVFALSGQIWLTQEGMHDDVILRPGRHERFDVRDRALILASAVGARAELYIAHPDDAACSADLSVHALLRARAQRQRTAARDAWIDRALMRLRALLHRSARGGAGVRPNDGVVTPAAAGSRAPAAGGAPSQRPLFTRPARA